MSAQSNTIDAKDPSARKEAARARHMEPLARLHARERGVRQLLHVPQRRAARPGRLADRAHQELRLAQMEFEVVESLDETERGSGGFGHTGK